MEHSWIESGDVGRERMAALESGEDERGGSRLRRERRQAEDLRASGAAIAGGFPPSVREG
jgi:hypothetical protein